MNKRFGILFGFFCLAMLDSIFAYAFPIDFTYSKLSVVWHFYLTGLLVFVRDKPWPNRLLIGAFAGIVRDLFFTSTFPFCFLFYPLLAWAAGIFQNQIRSTEFAFLDYMLCLFLVDFIPYLVQLTTGVTNVSIVSWLYHIELLTLLTGGLIVIVMIYADLVMDRFYLFQKHIRRKRQRRKNISAIETLPNNNHPASS